MKCDFPLSKFEKVDTPFYYYDTDLLERTLGEINKEVSNHDNYYVHYAVKANANPEILKVICKSGIGADCVSGWEVQAAVKAGFPSNKIVYAGVGKSDLEINIGLENDILCFNVESEPELDVINELAAKKGKTARIAFRVNPNVGAHTHANITTGLAENKFGVPLADVVRLIRKVCAMSNVEFVGLHFHIGSQITDMDDFKNLCYRINELQQKLASEGIEVRNINVGGGLGIDYDNPDLHPIPDFKSYFDTYSKYLELRPGQKLHFELGRSVVAQCGSLISHVLYVKQGTSKQFAILDAGMSDLIRPALYNAHHYIENLSSTESPEIYDVVGPICESSDVFAKGAQLNKCHRGDVMAIRSAGAYGEVMASCYNCRPLPKSYTSADFGIKE